MENHWVSYLIISLMWTQTVLSLIDQDPTEVHTVVKKNTLLNTSCTTSGLIKRDSSSKSLIWICESNKWIPYKIEPSLGKVKSLSAESCKHIKEALSTMASCAYPWPPTSGVYWVKDMQVFCDMETDSGGWTLVWQNSYLESLPFSTNMYYFSDYYKSCDAFASGWCNIPNKSCFKPTEQMIVAYHKGTIVYAYKGIFNYNIDYDWTGGVLVNFSKITDRCTRNQNIQPAPSAGRSNQTNPDLLGLSFDKHSPYNYKANCDTVNHSLMSPGDCRWSDCGLPSSISSTTRKTQQTVALYVR